MNRCPITYELSGDRKYSQRGLSLFSIDLKNLNDFPYTAKEQVLLATQFADKLSIQGIQPKLSVILNPTKEILEVVEKGGRYLLKPPHQLYEELPQNKDLTMKLAEIVNIEVPFQGMVYNIDGSLTYFIKRFDRMNKNQKVGTEDFSQLLGSSRDTKYDSSMEKVASILEKHCTFPFLEKIKLFRLVIFNFLVGNEDMHLKNFTLIRRQDKVELSPAYDLLNTTMVLQSKEEIALPIRGKKSRLTRADLVDYYGLEILRLSEKVLQDEMGRFERAVPLWQELLAKSFLSQKMQDSYKELIQARWKRLRKEI
ncbi:MAG: HipA domain-containing protein [Chlamydiota bacterium]